jgi:hypothetical protein
MNVSDQLHAMAALPQAKEPRCLLGRWPGCPQSQSRRHGEEINFLPCEEWNPDCPARIPTYYTYRAIPAHTFLDKRADSSAGFFRILPKERYSHLMHLVLKTCPRYGTSQLMCLLSSMKYIKFLNRCSLTNESPFHLPRPFIIEINKNVSTIVKKNVCPQRSH